jgi:8-oxo-dGTP diphosphatase
VLLAFRHNASADNGAYCIIGGRIEPGEAIHSGLIREIEEEVGVQVRETDKRPTGEEILSFDFIVNTWQGIPYNKEPHKHGHLQWFPLNKLPNTLLERHKITYQRYNAGSYYSVIGY